MNRLFNAQLKKRPGSVALLLGALILLTGIVAMAQMLVPSAPSLYQPSMARSLTQNERWQLDFDMVNEFLMREHNNYRFDAPGSFEKRARWFEETANWYQLADLMQQLVDFRKSAMRNNEKAFNQMFEMGQRGDIGAACTAALFYRNHSLEVTNHWKYSYEQVVREALKYKDTGHKVCIGTEGGLYLRGGLGYPKDEKLAKPFMMRSAVAGFYGYQHYMLLTHVLGKLRFEPKDFEASLCWNRVAYSQAGVNWFPGACDGYLRGVGTNSDLKTAPLPAPLIEIARNWCAPEKIVTAQTCADLEQQLDAKE